MSKQKLYALNPIPIIALPLCLVFSASAMALDASESDYDLKLLGKYVFFDKISEPQRMGCVTCHDQDNGGTGSVSGVNLHKVAITGANPHTVGSLKPPTNAYASMIAPFNHDCGLGAPATGNFCGGNFWNGRAEGRDPFIDGSGALFPAGATKHIGNEVFQGIDAAKATAYREYFGPTSDQALNPMPNPVEQNIDRQSVCQHVASAKYAELYTKAWGVPIDCRNVAVTESAPDLDNPPEKQFDISFKRIMLAVGAWQHSKELNSFSSKRDIALRQELACLGGGTGDYAEYYDPTVCAAEDSSNWGKFPLVGLTDQENLGHDLFYNTLGNPFAPAGPGANDLPNPALPAADCSGCHSDDPGLARGATRKDDGTEPFQLYADDAYHNIGTPANPELPADPDPGVGAHTGDFGTPSARGQAGFFKTPTMRNVDKRKGKGFIKAYTHNGWFKSLESIVHFYNTGLIGGNTANSFGITRCDEGRTWTEKQALAQNCWPVPEWPGAVLGRAIGNMGMTAEQEAAVVAYLKTLTDTETAKAPLPYKPAKTAKK
jgi:cytochrome c peroxidase